MNSSEAEALSSHSMQELNCTCDQLFPNCTQLSRLLRHRHQDGNHIRRIPTTQHLSNPVLADGSEVYTIGTIGLSAWTTRIG